MAGSTNFIPSVLVDAKSRWLKGYEVLRILQNHESCGVLSDVAPTNPTSGSIYLFNKKAVRYRKDGINWKKYKDGKTVRESHEKLSVGGVKVLTCGYTTSADDESFHRRTYWCLEGPYTDIVLVHYLSTKATLHLSDSGEHAFFPDLELFLDGDLGIARDETDIDESVIDFMNRLDDFPSSQIPMSHEDFSQLLTLPEESSNPLDNRIEEFTSMAMQTPASTPMAIPLSLDLPSLKILDFAPDWDYVEGGAKILIAGPDFCTGDYYCLFDQIEVPCEMIAPGLLRCRVPPHSISGRFNLSITRGNFISISETRQFEFRSRTTNTFLTNHILKLKIIEQLTYMEREIPNRSQGTKTAILLRQIARQVEGSHQSEYFETKLNEILDTMHAEAQGSPLSINGVDKDGSSLLHLATRLGYISFASMLIKHHADINLPDLHGDTPFDCAMNAKNHRMIKVLIDHIDLQSRSETSSGSEDRGNRTPNNSIEILSDALDGLGIQLLPSEAAVVIQRLYRGYRVREEIHQENQAAHKIQKAWKRHRTN
eukprot:TRINITY_DN12624_c0_g1_i1.p1 TRINITY_DN12624_c0_g1~~TRINITY_DN12624_c0_g1_i1.p1  ORF type:complete len:540 (-),score=101.81 TRINITY_DN12624_c0_g1_i1:25-1644(-)